MTANVLDRVHRRSAGLAHPSTVSNLKALGIKPGYVKSAPPHVDEKST